MKRSLIALAVLAAAGSASAQSTITLFGVADAAIQYGSGSISNLSRLGSGGLSSSILGFKGVEDLGGGMKAGFWLESGMTTDNGAGTATNTNNQTTGGALAGMNGSQGMVFNRRSTVSLGGAWGELRLGHDYTPQYLNQGGFDPFGNIGVGLSQTQASTIGGVTEVRASNSVSYLYGHGFNLDPLGTTGPNLQATYYMGENNSNVANSDDGNGYGLRVGYNAGPLTAGVATGRTQYLSGDIRITNAAFSYKFEVAKLIGIVTQEAVTGGATSKGYLIGGTIPVGGAFGNLVRLAYSHAETDAAGNPQTGKFALGYVYKFSNRTALYATVAFLNNSGPAAQSLNGSTTKAGDSSTGYDLGLKHSF